MKHKALIVLKALLAGMEIEDGGNTLCLSENNELCYKMLVETFPNTELFPPEEKLFQADISVTAFIKFCEKKSDDEIFVLVANLAAFFDR